MTDQVYYPESGSNPAPIYKRIRVRTPSGNLGLSYEIVYAHDDLVAMGGPDLSTPADMTDTWFVMLKDTFEWVGAQWAVIEQCNTASARVEVVAAKVNNVVVDYFVKSTLLQPPTY